MRLKVADEIRGELRQAGAADARVSVLSAYKQGYLWITERVIPELKGKGAKGLHIKIATYHPDLSKKYKFYQVPSRWLQELYPVDEIVAARARNTEGCRDARACRGPEGDLFAAGDRRGRQSLSCRRRSARRSSARVPREVPRLVSRGCDHRVAARRPSTDRQCDRCPHRNRSGALLGSLPAGRAAEASTTT